VRDAGDQPDGGHRRRAAYAFFLEAEPTAASRRLGARRDARGGMGRSEEIQGLGSPSDLDGALNAGGFTGDE
jgi:hypothetical protein